MTVTTLEDLLTALYRALAAGDPEALSDLLAPDVTVVGTDDAEWWSGKAEVEQALRAQMPELGRSGVSFASDGSSRAQGGAGDIVWVADRVELQVPGQASTPVRFTLVSRRVEESLLIQQMHLSIGSRNEETADRRLSVP